MKENRAMKIHANGIGIHYELEGPAEAPVVTLSHSLAANLTMWEPQMTSLLPRYRVLRYDMRGHGRSDVPEGPYTLDLLAEDVRALLLVLGIPRTIFVGLSIGSMIGQVLALKYPELLQGLVLCSTSCRTPPEMRPIWEERVRIARTRGMEAHVETTIERWFTKPFRDRNPRVVDPVRAMIRATPAKGYEGCAHAILGMDLLNRIDAIRMPTLIIVGEEDPATPVTNSRMIHERIRGSELVILKSASHLSNLERPEAFNRAMLDFLAKISPVS
jgi:3-oxoadipate enol-lactonase